MIYNSLNLVEWDYLKDHPPDPTVASIIVLHTVTKRTQLQKSRAIIFNLFRLKEPSIIFLDLATPWLRTTGHVIWCMLTLQGTHSRSNLNLECREWGQDMASYFLLPIQEEKIQADARYGMSI